MVVYQLNSCKGCIFYDPSYSFLVLNFTNLHLLLWTHKYSSFSRRCTKTRAKSLVFSNIRVKKIYILEKLICIFFQSFHLCNKITNKLFSSTFQVSKIVIYLYWLLLFGFEGGFLIHENKPHLQLLGGCLIAFKQLNQTIQKIQM